MPDDGRSVNEPEAALLRSDDCDEQPRRKISKLYRRVQESILENSEMTDEVQIELGRWVNILSDLTSEFPYNAGQHWWQRLNHYARKGSVDPADMLDRVELAIELLLSKPGSSLNLVRELRYEIRKDLCWNGGPFQRLLIRLNGGSAGMTVVWGALCTTVIGLPIITLLMCRGIPGFHGSDPHFLLIHQKIILGISVPAFLGAVVSIIARLRDFDSARSTDPKLLFMTAFFKPYIGMITGLFILSALAVGVGTINDVHLMPADPADAMWPDVKVVYFLYVVGFLAGFSERLTNDFVEMAEGRLGGRVPARAH